MRPGVQASCSRPSPGTDSFSRQGPTERVRLGMDRNLAVVPELHPFRAVSATESFRETEGRPLSIRRGLMVRGILENQPVRIQDGELLVGMKTLTPRGSPVFPEINCTWVERDLDSMGSRADTPFFVSDETKKILRSEVFPFWKGRQIHDRLLEAVPEHLWRADARGVVYHYFCSRTVGHITVGYGKILRQGVLGLAGEVDAALSALKHEDPGYILKRQFLESIHLGLEAMTVFAGRYAAEARRMALREQDPVRKQELERIAAVCDRVPAHPARTFHEALQSFWFTQLALNLETDAHAISPGRFDQYMQPFFQADLESGVLSRDQAQELLDLLWVKLDEITLAKDSGESQTSSSYPEFQNLNIGGLTPEGRDAANDVSFMCLTALEHVRAPQPGLSAQISSKTDPRFLLRCCDLLRQGLGMPAMFNSDTIVLGMVNRGKTLADARTGSVNGCVSPNCDGKDRMASSGYFNLAKCLELALNNGVDRFTGERLGPETGAPEEFETFEDVISAFRAQVRHFVDLKVHYDNIMRDIYAAWCPVPITSALIDDCIARARDWHQGGARYNQAVISGVGVGTLADALAGLKKHVFEDRTFTMSQILEALAVDWEGHEIVRQVLSRKTPHYGNDEDFADDLAVLTQRVFCEEVEQHRDVQGARYWVNLLPTTAHIALGQTTWATPDGRRAGEWLSEGVSPVQGHDFRGPTAAAKSVGKLDHARCNGTLLNMKISPQCLKTDEDLHKLAALIRGYFDLGGHHVQFNVFDVDTLKDAMERPDDFRNLLIRVAGYSDYFVLLSPDIQKEIISRTEHSW